MAAATGEEGAASTSTHARALPTALLPAPAVKHIVAITAALGKSEFLTDEQAALLVGHVLRSIAGGDGAGAGGS